MEDLLAHVRDDAILTINAMGASAPTRISARRGRAARRCKPGGWRNSCGLTCAAFCMTPERFWSA
jgi:hypothetical protein